MAGPEREREKVSEREREKVSERERWQPLSEIVGTFSISASNMGK